MNLDYLNQAHQQDRTEEEEYTKNDENSNSQ
jgi:hypothetical protein